MPTKTRTFTPFIFGDRSTYLPTLARAFADDLRIPPGHPLPGLGTLVIEASRVAGMNFRLWGEHWGFHIHAYDFKSVVYLEVFAARHNLRYRKLPARAPGGPVPY
jgi:hypothetical protein